MANKFKSPLPHIPSIEVAPELYADGQRQPLLDELNIQFLILHEENGKTKKSAAAREQARLRIAEIHNRADSLGLFVGQALPTPAAKRDEVAIAQASMECAIRAKVATRRHERDQRQASSAVS